MIKERVILFLINLIGYLLCIAIALLIFLYIVVPTANKFMFEHTKYVPVPCERQELQLDDEIRLL